MIDYPDSDDHFLMFSQMYYSQLPTQNGDEVKPPRRRRKKAKNGENGRGGGNGGVKKRKLTQEQIDLLEMSFGSEHKLETQRKDQLASELGLDPRQVAVWFQNRRARWKNKKLEEEYNKLKSAHDNVVVEKCRLESEVPILTERTLLILEASTQLPRVPSSFNITKLSSKLPTPVTDRSVLNTCFLKLLKLKDQLSDAEREIQRWVVERADVVQTNSPTSSITVENVDPPFIGEFGVDQTYDNVFYMPENTYIPPGMEWDNMYM